MKNLLLNVHGIVKDLIPVKIRGQVLVESIKAMLQPLQIVNNQFAALGKKIRYDLSFTGQVIYLEHLLNDVFDSTLRRIYITDSNTVQIGDFFVFYQNENQPSDYVYYEGEGVDTPYLQFESETVSNVDFIVFVPIALFNIQTEATLKALINKYKIAGKRYKIETF